jgi:hypothetical protein
MTDFEILPAGTRAALQEAAELLRGMAMDCPVGATRNDANARAAKLEAILAGPRLELPAPHHHFEHQLGVCIQALTVDWVEPIRSLEDPKGELIAVGFEPPPQGAAFGPPLDGC